MLDSPSACKNEWQYVQRMTSDTAAHFALLEVAIRTKFLPALLGIVISYLDGEFHELLTHSIKTGSIIIRHPVDTVVHVHDMSLHAPSHQVTFMVNKDIHLDLEDRRNCAVHWDQHSHTKRLGCNQKFVDVWGVDKSAFKRWDILASTTGLWLSIIPDRLRGSSPPNAFFSKWSRYHF
jgi:hypothetical protein